MCGGQISNRKLVLCMLDNKGISKARKELDFDQACLCSVRGKKRILALNMVDLSD